MRGRFQVATPEPEHDGDDRGHHDEGQAEVARDPFRVFAIGACRKIRGQRLSVFSRNQACTKLIAIATNVNVSSQNHGGRPASR